MCVGDVGVKGSAEGEAHKKTTPNRTETFCEVKAENMSNTVVYSPALEVFTLCPALFSVSPMVGCGAEANGVVGGCRPRV